MRWKSTWLLVLLAVVMFVYIVSVERHRVTGSGADPLNAKIVPGPINEITALQVRRTNQLVVRAERTNGLWHLTGPIAYPAQNISIVSLLAELNGLTGPPHITREDLAAEKRSVAEFGLDLPAATLIVQNAGQRTELNFGNKTAVGDQVYLQVQNIPGIFIVSATLFDRLPRSASDWRDPALIQFGAVNPDRFEVRAAGRGFAIGVDPTNNTFNLIKPTPARADPAKGEALLRQVEMAQVTQFVSDNPRADLEPYGLQTPVAELIFGVGTNDALVFQFGGSPTNDARLVYARRLSQTNIVLVAKSVLDALLTPYSELRERRLFTFSLSEVAMTEVVGPDSFIVRRQTNGVWVVGDPPVMNADGGLMADWITLLGKIEVEVEKDFVTDFAAYGLAKPVRQYLIKSVATNAAGQVTNQVIGQLDIGQRSGDKVFVRRADEQTVYSLSLGDSEQLPTKAWQLRDRRVWNFTTNQTQRITVRQRGTTRTLERNPQGRWTLAAGSQGVVRSSEAIEELAFRLGELRAVWWADLGEISRADYGFTDAGLHLVIDLKTGEKTQTLDLEFGGWAPSKFPYAVTTMEGQPVVFEFPLQLFWLLQRDLGILPGARPGEP